MSRVIPAHHSCQTLIRLFTLNDQMCCSCPIGPRAASHGQKLITEGNGKMLHLQTVQRDFFIITGNFSASHFAINLSCVRMKSIDQLNNGMITSLFFHGIEVWKIVLVLGPGSSRWLLLVLLLCDVMQVACLRSSARGGPRKPAFVVSHASCSHVSHTCCDHVRLHNHSLWDTSPRNQTVACPRPLGDRHASIGGNLEASARIAAHTLPNGLRSPIASSPTKPCPRLDQQKPPPQRPRPRGPREG